MKGIYEIFHKKTLIFHEFSEKILLLGLILEFLLIVVNSNKNFYVYPGDIRIANFTNLRLVTNLISETHLSNLF